MLGGIVLHGIRRDLGAGPSDLCIVLTATTEHLT